jgi:hypothetical protein
LQDDVHCFIQDWISVWGEGEAFTQTPHKTCLTFSFLIEKVTGEVATRVISLVGRCVDSTAYKALAGRFFSFMTRRILSWIKEMCVWKLNLLGVDDVTEAN